MKKKHIDAKLNLKPAKGHNQKTKGRMLRPARPDVTPFLSEPGREDLEEILSDLRFVSQRDNLDAIDLLETFIHFWKQEIRRKTRLQVAHRLHTAKRFGYLRIKDRQREHKKEYDDIANRLIDALKLPQES